MTDRLQEIRARLNAATPGPWTPVFINGVESPGIRNPVPPWAREDFIAHAPADIAWLLDNFKWMDEERSRVIGWLSDHSGGWVSADEVLFLFGLVRGRTLEGDEWGGHCSCGAKTYDDCSCRKTLI